MKLSTLEIRRVQAQEDIAALLAEVVKRLESIEAKIDAANKPAKAPKAKVAPAEDESKGEG